MKRAFKAGNIILPKNVDMTKWSVVACDQYTSEPEYWNSVEKLVGDSPSTYNLILPEIYLDKEDTEKRIEKINKNMEAFCNSDNYVEYKDSLIYLERTQSDGRVREGLIGIVDLEEYNYEVGSESLIRATEKTVIERIPPRIKVRKNALLELPHIMILIDDEKKKVIEPLKNIVKKEDLIYDFDLMQNGGHVKGYLLNKDTIESVLSNIDSLGEQEYFENKYNVKDKGLLLFAMGDGNHSLATAKAHYEALKKTMSEEEYLNHPARYALAEIVNLHSDALEFEAIHRVVFNTDVNDLLNELHKYYNLNENGNGEYVEIVTNEFDKKYYIENPKSNLSVGSIQIFLDEYLSNHEGKIDYIHGDDVTRNFGKEEGNIAFLFNPMQKNELFKSVILDGALPRKTFSMGHANDKRYYLEARKIK